MSGNLYALDSNDGTVRFKQNTEGAIAGGVITYRIADRQYLAVTSGNISRFIWGETGLPHIVIYGQSSDRKGLIGPTVTAAAESTAVALGRARALVMRLTERRFIPGSALLVTGRAGKHSRVRRWQG